MMPDWSGKRCKKSNVCAPGSVLGRTSMIKFSRSKAGDELVVVLKGQRGLDILAHPFGGGGGEGQADSLGEALAYLNNLAVFGPEVVAPFGDAVRFVNGQAESHRLQAGPTCAA